MQIQELPSYLYDLSYRRRSPRLSLPESHLPELSNRTKRVLEREIGRTSWWRCMDTRSTLTHANLLASVATVAWLFNHTVPRTCTYTIHWFLLWYHELTSAQSASFQWLYEILPWLQHSPRRIQLPTHLSTLRNAVVAALENPRPKIRKMALEDHVSTLSWVHDI